jgi:hypothetical protein
MSQCQNSTQLGSIALMPTCRYCGITKSTSGAVKKHVQLTSSCPEHYVGSLSDTRSIAIDLTDKIRTSEHRSLLGETEQAAQLPTAFCDATAEDSPSEKNSRAAWSSPAEWPWFAEAYPGATSVPISSVKEKTSFELIRDAEDHSRPWGKHFKSEEEWQLAKWLLRNVGQNQMDKFLKLLTVRSHKCTSY